MMGIFTLAEKQNLIIEEELVKKKEVENSTESLIKTPQYGIN